MAFPTPAAVLLNENMQIHKGKRADAPSAKPLKSAAKHGLQERKALQDVSNVPQGTTALKNRCTVKERSILKERSAMKERSILKQRPALHNVSNTLKEISTLKERHPLQDVSNILKERSILKEKSTLRSHGATKNPVNTFTDEEIKKCDEWANDGVEGIHFTGNDSQKLDKHVQDKRVKKKVAKVMSALHGWSDVVFDPVMFPDMEVLMFSEVKELELEPDVLPDITSCLSTTGKRDDAPRATPPKTSVNPRLQERKALQNLSNILKEKSILKERPALHSHEVIKNPMKIFTVEEAKRCHEWAKDAVEGTHFTTHCPQKLDKDVQDECDKAILAKDSPCDDELDEYAFLDDNPVKFELRDESATLDPELGRN